MLKRTLEKIAEIKAVRDGSKLLFIAIIKRSRGIQYVDLMTLTFKNTNNTNTTEHVWHHLQTKFSQGRLTIKIEKSI